MILTLGEASLLWIQPARFFPILHKGDNNPQKQKVLLKGGIMNTYKVGIVGFGWVAGAHLKSFVELPNYEPVAIMSRRKLDPAPIKEEYGVEVKIYNDYDEMLKDEDIDIIDICTPHPFHAEQTIKAAEAKKNLIIEKPIALTFENAVKMLEAVEKNQVLTSVCFEARFTSVAKAMKSIIDQGLIGSVYYSECDYCGSKYKLKDGNLLIIKE